MDQFNGGANGPRKKSWKEIGGTGGGAGDTAKDRAGEGTAGRGRWGGGGAGDAAEGRAGEGTADGGSWRRGGAGDAGEGRAGEGTADGGSWRRGGAGDAGEGRAGEGTADGGSWRRGGAGDAGEGRAGEGTADGGSWRRGGAGDAGEGRAGEGTADGGSWRRGGAGDAGEGRAGEGTTSRGRWGGGGAGDAGKGRAGEGTAGRGRWGGGADARRVSERDAGRQGGGARMKGGWTGGIGGKESERDWSKRNYHGMGYKKLEELSTKDPSVVAMTLSFNTRLEEDLSATTMKPDLVRLLCLVLSKAFTSQPDRCILQHLAGIIKKSGFFRTVLPHYVMGMGSESDPTRRAQYPTDLENILTILSEVLSFCPASSAQAVGLLLTLLQPSIITLTEMGVRIPPQTEQRLENIRAMIQHLQEKSRDGTLRTDRDTYALLSTGGEDNQQDFRFIPIYPTPEEFHQEHKPLLRPNLTSQRYSNTELYLDTHFRLLREDFVRPLRDGIQQLRRSQAEEGGNLKTKRFDDILVYFDTRLVVPKCTSSGLAYVVQFDVEPLKFLHWENSKRLIYGSLVCLSCDLFESFLFATVTDRDPKALQEGQVNISFTEESRFKLATMEKDQVFLMVETTAYFEAYRHVLRGLQQQKEDNLPFQRYIVECNTDVRPPAYLQIKDDYDLSAIALPAHKGHIRPFRSLEPRAWPGKEDLGLDESQMRALQLALTKELAIIQGPPGTGKTYVGLKIAHALLTNDRYGSAPMLVVCYTNHALDQFLEGIHTFMKTGIVRVGGRSNSEILKQFNLSELSRSPDFKRILPDYLQRAYSRAYAQLCDEERAIQAHTVKLECSMKGVLRETFLQIFISCRHWNSLNRPQMALDGFLTQSDKKSSVMMEWLGLGSIVLQRETENADRNKGPFLDAEEGLIDISEEADQILADRFIEDNIRGIRKKEDSEKTVRVVEERMLAMNLDEAEIQPEQSEDGWQMQRHQKKKMKRYIIQELQKSSAMTEAEEDAVLDIWTLSQPDRWKLYRLWVARYRAELCSKALESQEDYQEAVDRLAHVRHYQNIGFLKRAKVIGMTTTGAAKFRKILQEVQPRLVIVEEAAEVLEAHTVTTLSKACQHLILIGDHQQLRPSATVYELAKNFNLEMSMFERLVKMGLPFVRLDYQHRMRPEIARLLTPHIYAELENHPSVLRYDNIKGLKTNLFFVEHEHPEEMIKDGKSHKNKHEATFVVSLCRYLIFQGYKPEKITILTTYSGQLYCLRTLMPAKEFTGVKVHVVDKYQGEENDIVLLSLVRSNPAGKMGFLNIANRVCVALSRAKKGLYCIGDSAMLSKSELWKNIFHTLREKDQIGNALTLCCQNHPHRQIQASNADDFKQAPKGGCTEPCKFRLDCGHVCASVCHPYDPEHKEYKCVKKCQKVLCDLKHSCTRLCHETCPQNCQVRVEKILPRCQHKQMAPCHQDPETFQCNVKVDFELKCGHIQQDACFYQLEKVECRKPCEQQLNCGHTCSGTCGQCFQGRVHRPCSYRCDRLLICSHMCRDPCTMNCPPCRMPCENCCVHSQCMKPCGQPCTPCMETCPWQCDHQSCSKLCHEPCDRQPCTQPCANTLDCGHPCIGLCGDKCPSKCRICHREEVTEIFFGTEDEPDAYFIQLEDCGHIIEYKAMDKHMGVNDNQQENEGEEVAIKLKECPKCKTPIRKNLRYGSHIKRCLAEIEMVKVKINGSQEEIDGHRETLRNQWAVNRLLDEMQSQEEYIHIITRLGAKHQTAKDLWALENKMHFLTRVAKLKKIQMEHMSGLRSLRLGEYVEQFLRWLNICSQRFTDQQVSDLERELQRITLLAELGARCQAADLRGQSANIQSEVQTMTEVLEKCSQFTEPDEHRVKEAMKELDNKVPRTGLGIKEEEKRMIVSALKMQPGHWFKCPNGHIYIITECGGATESRRCTDCNATIGGANHALASGNQVATEMDGSQHPAWSEANNLQNFQF